MDSRRPLAQTTSEASTGQHDARTGFHDIKPIPFFATSGGSLFVWGALLFAALGIAYLLLMLRKDQKAVSSNERQVSAKEDFFKVHAELSKQLSHPGVEPRAISTELSQAFRTYLEAELKFPALESTASQVIQALGLTIAKNFVAYPTQKAKELCEDSRALLSALDKVTFGDEHEPAYRVEVLRLSEQLEKSALLVTRFESAIRREAQRREGVLAQTARETAGAAG